MDKTEIAKCNGVDKAHVIIPVHGIQVTDTMFTAYLSSGELIMYSLDKMQDDNMTVMPLQEPSAEVVKAIKEMARRYGKSKDNDHRQYNVGNSDYAQHKIQPWDIWREYHLDPWSADIVKRILRTKTEEGLTHEQSRRLDLEKIKHICDELISQIDQGYKF